MSLPQFDAGRYATGELLKQNSHVRVYRAVDQERETQVILKVLRDDTDEPAVADAMFDREMAALELLQHQHIVRKLRAFRENDAPVLVLEYVPDGQTLESRVAQGTRPPLEWRIQALQDILQAVQHAHSQGVIHRDLGLGNILFDTDEQTVKLSDFGIAKLQRALELSSSQTLRGFYTLPYAAPEQVRGHEPSTRSDLYSFGVVMAAVLSWTVPPPTFERSNLEGVLNPFAREVDAKSYQRTLAYLRDLLDLDPRLRPTAHEMQEVLKLLAIAAGPSKRVVLRLSQKSQEVLRQLDLTRFQAADDLNTHLKGLYKTAVDKTTGEPTYVLELYGQSLQLLLRPENRSGAPEDSLFISNVEQPPSEALGRRRAGADELAITVSLANSADPSVSALPLIDALRLRHQEREDLKVSQEARKAFLQVPQTIADFRRQQLKGLQVTYQPTAASGGRRPLKLTTGQLVTVQLKGAARTHLTQSLAIPGTGKDLWRRFNQAFKTDLGERANVFIKQYKRPIGTVESFDPRTGRLQLRPFRRSTLPRQGELQLIDAASSSSLLREEEAIDAFVEGSYVNPELARRIMDPATNDLNETKPRTPIQAQLDPEGEHARILGQALAAEDFFLVQGPPGTGKTTLIVDLIGQILAENPAARILVTSQSNKAVDTILSRLADLHAPWRFVRYASEAWADQSELPSYEESYEQWLLKAKAQCEEALMTYTPQGTEQPDAVREVLQDWVTYMGANKELQADFLAGTSVFGATCSTAAVMQRTMKLTQFDWVIFDEAARATVAESLIPLIRARRCVMVGDHKQLPPYLEQATAAELRQAGFNEAEAKRSLFEKLFEEIRDRNRRSLQTQYRMHSSIAKLVGNVFYSDIGGLDTGILDTERPMPIPEFDGPSRVYWVDVRTAPTPESSTTSTFNAGEVGAVRDMLQRLSQGLPADDVLSVSVISPYAAQVRALRDDIGRSSHQWPNLQIRTGTVDAFQGEEDDVVICSLVKTAGEAEFVTDPNRLNVTFSRAKSLLVIIGNYAEAQAHHRLAEVIHPTFIPAGQVWAGPQVALAGGQA